MIKLEEILKNKKQVIVRKWFDMVVDTYPADTSRFLKKQKDPFANPVGSTTINGLEGLVDTLWTESNRQEVISLLDPIIRIRAVQNFSASSATGFIFFLKSIIREIIKDDIDKSLNTSELLQLESRIDGLALVGFDIYMQCREKVYQLKNDEIDRKFRAFERAGLISRNDLDDKKPDIQTF